MFHQEKFTFANRLACRVTVAVHTCVGRSISL